jgi:hypothetical protein
MKNNQKAAVPSHHRVLTRARYLETVRQASAASEYRFAREAVLRWLASYPGDLEAGLFYAQALLGEGFVQEALPILSGLCVADPEFLDAAQTWLDATTQARREGLSQTPSSERKKSLGRIGEPIPSFLSLTIRTLQTYVSALTDEPGEAGAVASWGDDLRQARQALESGDLDRARRSVRKALETEPPLPLAAVIHLHYLERSRTALDVRLELAKRYYRLWPDCLACALYLAHWSLEADNSAEAVALLHQVAARDVGAQVAGRLWKGVNPYHSLWPAELAFPLDMTVPARVAALLGWNRLSAGGPAATDEGAGYSPAGQDTPAQAGLRSATAALWSPLTPPAPDEPFWEQPEGKAPEGEPSAPALLEDSEIGGPVQASSEARRLEKETFQQAMEDLAKRHNAPGVTRLDGRFPVYVVFSTRDGLQTVYGRRAASVLEAEMFRLVETIQHMPGWGARLFLADDPASTMALGIRPARSGDPWSLKLALADLDAALAGRGEMIGAVLIVGDPEVVPFHNLPNPLDDQDANVPSDNPYATRDKNYFIPEWPVGRLPAGGNARLLLELLQRLRKAYAARLQELPWHRRLLRRLRSWLRSRGAKSRPSFGYTAAVWRRAAAAVYRPIGSPRILEISPPRGVVEGTFLDPLEPVEVGNGFQGGVPLPVGQLGYFNLHGLVDAPEWYGQRDPLQAPNGPDYPVALRPEDIEAAANGSRSKVPRVVFSEACYGLHIQDRNPDQAIALKFLQSGSLAVAGSTCMAYGSIDTPLVAADLLGYAFWRALQDGVPAGEALRQAKIILADEMDRRQGFLDGEDQKTLISFILYGDPLAQSANNGALQPKGVLRLATPPGEVKTICDRMADGPDGAKAPADVLASVHQVVSQYLPGMSDAHVQVAYPRPACTGAGHNCPTSQLGGEEQPVSKQPRSPEGGYRLVTLSKMVQRTEGMHAHYARLTLDERGGVLKLVVSR